MMDELKAKILKDIEKSGFLSEMKANEILFENNWKNIHNAETFYDKDMDKSREIDILTYQNKIDNQKQIEVGIHLIIEVKKSQKPWIIFCQDKKDINKGLGWGILNFHDNVTNQQLSYNNINKKNRHSNSTFFGTSYYEAFKEPSETSQIYSALITCCKAAVHNKKLNSWIVEQKKYSPSDNHHIDFFLPLIVLDGIMFKSELNSDGEACLEQIDYSPIKLNYSSKNYKETRFYPEIVTLAGLNIHLKKIEEWHQSIFDTLKEKI